MLLINSTSLKELTINAKIVELSDPIIKSNTTMPSNIDRHSIEDPADNMQISRYANMQISRYANMQTRRRFLIAFCRIKGGEEEKLTFLPDAMQ